MLHLIFGWHLWDARNGASYNTWSGWLADIALASLFTAIVASLVAWWRKHNCHVHRCWRLQWHAHPDHGHPVCAVHHPSGHHGTWWRIFHSQPRPRDHFLSAALHGYDHTKAPERPMIANEFEVESTNVSVYGTATGDVDVVVGEATPEKPKRQRVRKPGTDAVTDITKKKPPPKDASN